MRETYANSRIVPVSFDDTIVSRLNEMALGMQIPRNRIIRRMLELMLSDIDGGRKLYPDV